MNALGQKVTDWLNAECEWELIEEHDFYNVYMTACKHGGKRQTVELGSKVEFPFCMYCRLSIKKPD